MLTSSAEQTRYWQEQGVLLLAYSSEVGVLQDGFRRALAQIKGE